MSRAERWWRPAPRRNVRPAVRSARRGRYADGQRYVDGFEVGYRAGLADDTTAGQRDAYEQLRREADAAEQGDMEGFELGMDIAEERKRHERLEGGLRRLMDAIRESENGDSGPLDDLAREAGVMPDDEPVLPMGNVDPGQLVDELEAWLRERGVNGA